MSMSVAVDDYIKSPEILNSQEFKDKNFWIDPKSYWLPVDFKPKTRKQKLVFELWRPFISNEEIKFAGFEYWSNVLESGRSLDAHKDRDEKLFEDTGENAHPLVGSVYYPIIDSVVGGQLMIYKDGIEAEPTETIPPAQNRIVFFEAGKLWHKVAPVISGTRAHFAVNVWEKEPYGVGKEGGMLLEN